MEPSAVERQVDAVIDAARNVEWEAHFGANWAGRAKELAKAREHLLAFASRPTADLDEDVELVDVVARALALESDIDPDVFIGMHGRALWEKQWHGMARAAIRAVLSRSGG